MFSPFDSCFLVSIFSPILLCAASRVCSLSLAFDAIPLLHLHLIRFDVRASTTASKDLAIKCFSRFDVCVFDFEWGVNRTINLLLLSDHNLNFFVSFPNVDRITTGEATRTAYSSATLVHVWFIVCRLLVIIANLESTTTMSSPKRIIDDCF